MGTLRKVLTYGVIVCIAMVCALNYQLFVFPNQFAPSGLNGICTMIQYITGISVGYMSLLVNIPLALLVYFKVSKPLAVRSMVYVVTFSLALVLLDHVDLSRFVYHTDSSAILGPLVAGIIYGSCYNYLLKCSAYSGGTDFVAALIHKNHPEKGVIGLTFTINALVAMASYFVYDYQIEPVILCILYAFTSSTISEQAVKSGRSALRYEIITDHPEELSRDIISKLHHSATVVPARGMYRGHDTNVVICVVNKTQATALNRIIRSYPRTFAIESQVTQVMGNFKRLDNKGNLEKSYLDHGDESAV